MDATRSLYEGSLFVREVSVSVNSHISISRFHWSLVAAPTHSLHSFRCRARLIRFFPRFFYDSALIAFNLCEFYLMSLLSTVRLFTTAVVALFLLLARLCLGSQSDIISSPLFLWRVRGCFDKNLHKREFSGSAFIAF